MPSNTSWRSRSRSGSPAAIVVGIVQVTGMRRRASCSESIVTRPHRPQDELATTLRRSARNAASKRHGLAEQEDVDDVVHLGMIGMAAVLDRAEIGRRSKHALRPEKAGGERTVLAWRPHDDGERPAVQADFERFFDRGQVTRGTGVTAFGAAHDRDAARRRYGRRSGRPRLVRHGCAASARAGAAPDRSGRRDTPRRARGRGAGSASTER